MTHQVFQAFLTEDMLHFQTFTGLAFHLGVACFHTCSNAANLSHELINSIRSGVVIYDSYSPVGDTVKDK